jgi:tetratricopeptide (TPR) repeat protein
MDIHKSIELAFQNYHSGNIQQSKQICAQALKEDPDNEEILYILGLVHAHLEEYDLAIQYFKRSLKINVTKADAYLALGAVSQKKLLFDEAVDFYRKALEIDPEFAEAFENMGDIFRETGRFEEAVSCYKKVLHYYPDAAEVHCSLGGVFKARGQLDLAVFYYRNALRYKPDYAEAYGNLGIIFHEQRRLDEAIGCYEKALQCNPDLVGTSMNLEDAFHEKREREQGMKRFRDWIGVTVGLRFLNIEMMINALINQFYFRHLKVQFHPDILHDEDYASGPKRQILERLFSETGQIKNTTAFFSDLERLHAIRKQLANRHSGVMPLQKNAGEVHGDKKTDMMKAFRTLHHEFMSKAASIEAHLVKIFHS